MAYIVIRSCLFLAIDNDISNYNHISIYLIRREYLTLSASAEANPTCSKLYKKLKAVTLIASAEANPTCSKLYIKLKAVGLASADALPPTTK